MSVTNIPLRAETGFISPGFFVSPTGSIETINITASGNISVTQNLTTTGNINSLNNITANGNINAGGNLNVVGQVQAESIVLNGLTLIDTDSTTLGLNTDIKESGLTKLGILEILEVSGDSYLKNSNNLNILTIINGIVTITSQTKGNIDNIVIGNNMPVEGYFTELTGNNVTVSTTPTEPYHATRKDYVDTTIAALSIALGA